MSLLSLDVATDHLIIRVVWPPTNPQLRTVNHKVHRLLTATAQPDGDLDHKRSLIMSYVTVVTGASGYIGTGKTPLPDDLWLVSRTCPAWHSAVLATGLVRSLVVWIACLLKCA